MAISRSLMNRQLQANGGIMQVAPREKFGLGSSIKKFVRKIIPNEVAEVAVKAAPFVAPFNPAVAAAMSGLGTFDQTGSIGDSLKGGALTYGLGQGARYLGGAELQGNPFQTGGAFRGGLEGLKAGFSSPLGTQSGFKLGQPVQEVQGVGTTGDASIAEQIAAQGRAVNAEQTGLFTEGLTGGAETITDAATQTITGSPNQMTITDSIKQIVSPNSTIGDRGNAALDLLKRGSKAAFTKTDANGNRVIDKAAVLGAATFAASYAEARALAADAGIDLTEEEYDESLRDEKKAEYAGYLQNFFGGKKDGGRIGYESGANEMIKTKLLEEIMPETDTEEMITIMGEDGVPIRVKKSDYEAMPGMFRDTTTGFGANINRIEEANGGRIGLKFGSEPEEAEVGIMAIDVEAGDDEDEEDMLMAYSDAIFDRREKSALFRSLGDPRIQQTTKSFKDLDKILKNPGMFPEDEFMLKEYLKLKGFKDGGRIGLKDGTDESLIEKLLNSKIAQEGRYGASEFFFGDPIMFGTPDKFKDGKNDNRGTFKRNPSDYDKLSPEKQAYIEAFLNSDEGQLFLKPGKIKFPTDERMREHNKKITLEDFNEDRNPLELLLGIDYENRAKGGRIGYKYGSGASNRVAQLILERDYLLSKDEDVSYIDAELESLGYKMRSEGGIMEAKVPTGQIRKNNAGVTERDYREEGGFVPVGIKERADDVPAMLSKNEFVMTADAVRGIGNGSVEEGSKKLYNTMKQAEQVGKA